MPRVTRRRYSAEPWRSSRNSIPPSTRSAAAATAADRPAALPRSAASVASARQATAAAPVTPTRMSAQTPSPSSSDHSADADDGVSRRLVRQLLVAPAVPFGRHRNADLGEDLVRLQGGGQEIEKELPRRNAPLTSRSSGDDRRVERQNRRRIVGGRIGVGERAADRSPIANLPVANPRRGVRQERNRGSNLGVGRDLMMGGQRADRRSRRRHAARLAIRECGRCRPAFPAPPGATS